MAIHPNWSSSDTLTAQRHTNLQMPARRTHAPEFVNRHCCFQLMIKLSEHIEADDPMSLTARVLVPFGPRRAGFLPTIMPNLSYVRANKESHVFVYSQKPCL